MTRRYASPVSFKEAVEVRLKRGTLTGFALQRRRQVLLFQRLLTRIQIQFGNAVVLKGGFALELRLEHARSTRDVDLVMRGTHDSLLERLQAAGQIDLGDFMTFEVQEYKHSPDVIGDGVRYGGKRFRVECKLAGKVYGARFGLDIVFGGVMLGEPALKAAEDLLGFAGIQPPTLRLLPIETHIAEKLHAYTLPRSTPNDRVRDLPDIALLATSRDLLSCDRIREALAQTFGFRGTHEVPTSVPIPPSGWRTPYAEIVAEHDLQWADLDTVFDAVARFLDPVLGKAGHGAWQRATWSWEPVDKR